MINTIRIFSCMFAVLLVPLPPVHADFNDTDTDRNEEVGPEPDLFGAFRSQFTAYYTRTPASDAQTQEHADSQRTDGGWGDIDYSSTATDGGWALRGHLSRLQSMAEVYVSPESGLYRDRDLRRAINDGLSFWVENDFSNRNWWWRRIGIPRPVAVTLVLMGDDVPDAIVHKALNTVLSDSRTSIDPRRTGQNKVWMAGIELKKGWIRKDRERMVTAAEAIFSEIRTTQREGIQPDWSFHQHGSQLQLGTYGLNLALDQILWIHALSGTEVALTRDKLEIFRNFLLEGQSWVLWNDRYDLNAMARRLSGQQAMAGNLARVLRDMMKADPEYASVYESRMQTPNELIGSKVFWRSDFAVHRRPDWYTSVRMSSTRLIGAENTLGNNNRGLHGSAGVQLVYLGGDEYEDIAPLWDWRRLPGTTVDQGITDLQPATLAERDSMRGNSDFVGGLGEGSAGVSTMIYERDGFVARKAWFFEENAIICLGAGIDGPSVGEVYTSVEQSWRSGPVVASIGELAGGHVSLPAGAWVHHSGIGYKLNSPATVDLSSVTGDWRDINTQDPSRPVSGDVFNVWINHGESPEHDHYSYTVYPRTQPENMERVIANHETSILSNTTDLQATEGAHGLHAIFYTPGEVKMSNGNVVAVNAPCVLSLRNNALLVCDPTRSLGSVEVTINGKTITVTLPSGGQAGSQVTVAAGTWGSPEG